MLQLKVMAREGESPRLSYLYLCYDPDLSLATLVAHAKFVNLFHNTSHNGFAHTHKHGPF